MTPIRRAVLVDLVARTPDLGLSERLLAIQLALSLDSDGSVQMSYAEVGRLVGVGERQAKRLMKELLEHPTLGLQRTYNHRPPAPGYQWQQDTNTYDYSRLMASDDFQTKLSAEQAYARYPIYKKTQPLIDRQAESLRPQYWERFNDLKDELLVHVKRAQDTESEIRSLNRELLGNLGLRMDGSRRVFPRRQTV